jgi:hypothetical protein
MLSVLKYALAAASLSLCAALSPAVAGSVTQPGETIGLPVGAPLAPGFYFLTTFDWGCRSTPLQTCAGVNIPVIAWSTPWKPLGARLQFLGAVPELEVGVHKTTYLRSMYNPWLAGQLAWDLGNTGWGISYLLGAYFDVGQELAWDSTTINQRLAISYFNDYWNLTANLIYGTQLDHVSNQPQISPCPAPFIGKGCNPDYLNLDLTATKRIGKWEIGPVAFGSWDVSTPVSTYTRQSQFAVGGLLGYYFGPVILQGYVTTDVYEHNYNGYDTRFWGRVIVPLGNPFAEPVPPAPLRVRG